MATAPKKTATPSPYSSIVGGNLAFAGVDQGIDFTGSGPIYALDEGKVTRVASSGTGWPGIGALLSYSLSKGGAAGRNVYVAEDFRAAAGIAQGVTVHKGQVIGYATGSGQAPGIEIGWADAGGRPVAPLPAPRPASQYTPEGQDFLNFATGKSGSSLPSASQSGFSIPGLGKSGGSFLSPGGALSPGGVTGGGDVGKAIGIPSLPENAIQRSGEMLAGAVLLLVAIVMVGKSAAAPVATRTVATGAANTVRAPGRRRQRAAATAQRQQASTQRAASAAQRQQTSTKRAQVRESRAGELHAAKLNTEKARATDLRSRSRARTTAARQTKEQRAAAERSAYYQGAADAGR